MTELLARHTRSRLPLTEDPTTSGVTSSPRFYGGSYGAESVVPLSPRYDVDIVVTADLRQAVTVDFIAVDLLRALRNALAHSHTSGISSFLAASLAAEDAHGTGSTVEPFVPWSIEEEESLLDGLSVVKHEQRRLFSKRVRLELSSLRRAKPHIPSSSLEENDADG